MIRRQAPKKGPKKHSSPQVSTGTPTEKGPQGFLKRIGMGSGGAGRSEERPHKPGHGHAQHGHAPQGSGPRPGSGSGEKRESDRRDNDRRDGERRDRDPWSGGKSSKKDRVRPGSVRQNAEGRFSKLNDKRGFKKKDSGKYDKVFERQDTRKKTNKRPFGKFREYTSEVQKNSRGFAFLLLKEGDIFIPPEFATKLLTGDIVKVICDERTKEVSDVEIKKRAIKSFIGTYEANFDRRVVVLSDRTMKEDVQVVERPNLPGLKHGDKVLVEITKYEPVLEGRILQTFGTKLAPKLDTFSVVVRSQWPQEFSKTAVDEAERLSREIQQQAQANGYKGRKDLRDKHFVTIDGADARDFDDAVLVEKTKSGFVLYVAIADVGEFLRKGTTLDEEAYARATSVYFPEWVIPMLPEALSNGSCSLRPDEDKLTLTCEMHFDHQAKKKAIKVYESVIRSKRRCIYEDVQKEFEKGDSFWKAPYELYELIKTSRFKRGALDLDLPEAKVVLDENSDTIDIQKRERLDSHRLIEEFMIAANESVTELMEREGWPFVYRVHEPPKQESLQRFENFASVLGLKPKFGDGTDPKIISRFIDTLKGNPLADTLYYLMLRSLKQARYDTMNLFHFGLASRAYTHFTSPIRRYPDTMVHRILKRYVRHEKFSRDEHDEYSEYLADACDWCSKQERKAESLDRVVTKVKKARFMEKKFGEEFEAKITNVSEAGIFIELKKWFVDGLLPMDELEGDWFEFIESKLMLKGRRTGKKYRIGDSIRVSVLRTDIDNGYIDFTLAENLEELKEEENADLSNG